MKNLTFRNILEPKLADLGYNKVQKLLYRSKDYGPAVEHFLEFELWGGPLHYVSCDFGIANKDALRFATECLSLYGGAIYRRLPVTAPVFNARCQVGRFCEWGRRDSLGISELGANEVSGRALKDIEDIILLKAGPISTLEAFASQILADEPWMPWLTSNGAMRAAEYIYAARQVGISRSAIASNLEPFSSSVKRGLDRETDASIFLEQSLSHWGR